MAALPREGRPQKVSDQVRRILVREAILFTFMIYNPEGTKCGKVGEGEYVCKPQYTEENCKNQLQKLLKIQLQQTSYFVVPLKKPKQFCEILARSGQQRHVSLLLPCSEIQGSITKRKVLFFIFDASLMMHIAMNNQYWLTSKKRMTFGALSFC